MMRELKTIFTTNIFLIKTMKTKFFLSAAVMTVALFTSCSNEANGPNVGQTGTLKLTVTGTPVSRATGELPVQADENTVTSVTVGLFDHTSHNATSITEGTLTGGTITISNVPALTTQDVVVVANAPTKAFVGATTLDAFRAKTMALTQAPKNLPMSGENVTGTSIAVGSTVEADVTISRLVARVQVTSISTNFSSVGPYANATFALDRVFLYNAASTSAVGVLSSGTQLATSNFVHGYDGTKIGSADLLDKLTTPQSITSTAYTTKYYYYAFEDYFPTGITELTRGSATKLVLAGTFCPDAVNAPTTTYYMYYPVVVNRDQTGTVIDNAGAKNTGIQRNNIYSITATISGLGVSSPAEFIEPSSVNVKVTISNWNLTVGQTVNF